MKTFATKEANIANITFPDDRRVTSTMFKHININYSTTSLLYDLRSPSPIMA